MSDLLESMFWINKAIRHLDPSSEYTMKEDDLDSIEWIVKSNKTITKDDIQNAIPIVKELEQKKIKESLNAKALLLNRLGITEEEAKLLLS